jgi:hypothetical protein
MALRQYLQNLYLDYFNNFGTVAGFSSYYNILPEHSEMLIRIGREIHNEETQDGN